jgi:DNA-binding winged helix-turn-helix (wHTH) protein/tetratricopeptide (TPR) repeat protein
MLYAHDDIELDSERFELRRTGNAIRVEPRVFEVLLYLARNAGRLVTKQELIDRVWDGTIVTESALTRCIMEARRAIGDAERDKPIILTVHGRGYRFHARAETSDAVSTSDSGDAVALIGPPSEASPTESHRDGGPLRTTPARTKSAIAMLVLVAAAVAGIAAIDFPPGENQPPVQSARVALVPVSVAEDDRELQLIAVSIGDLLERRLTDANNLIVRGPDYSRAASLTAGSLAQLAEQTGSDHVVSGTLRRSHHRGKAQLSMTLHRLSAAGQVIDTPLGTYDIPLLNKPDDVRRYAAIRDRIAGQVASTLLPAVTITPTGNLTPRHTEAYRLYLLARERLGDGTCDGEASLELLRRSLELDPQFAPAWEAYGRAVYGMASSCTVSQRGYDETLRAAGKALELAPGYGAAIGLKATVLVETGRVEDAYELLVDAEKSNPTSPDLQSFLTYVLDYSGYTDEARQHFERLLTIDPNYLTQRGWTPNTYLYTGEIDRFLDVLPATDSPLFRYHRGLALVVGGRAKEAYDVLEPAFRTNPNDSFARMSHALLAILDERRGDARRIVDELVRQRRAVGSSDGEMTYKIAQLYALAGVRAAALQQLRLAVSQGFFCVRYLESDPLLHVLRSEPEYGRILDAARTRHITFGNRFGVAQQNQPPGSGPS